MVQIEAKSFQQLTHLRFLDLSHNENLTFKSLSNITEGLNFTNIAILKLNKVHKTYGPCTILTEENLKGFKRLKLKEIYLESNRIATLEPESVNNIPLTLESMSLKDNLLLADHYITCLLLRLVKGSIEKITISDQFISRDISEFIPGLDSHHSSINTRKTKREVSIEQDNMCKPQEHQKSKLLQNIDGQKQIKSERDAVSRTKAGVNKTEMVHGIISHHMKRHSDDMQRHSDDTNVIKQTDGLISPENQSENKLNWVWIKILMVT